MSAFYSKKYFFTFLLQIIVFSCFSQSFWIWDRSVGGPGNEKGSAVTTDPSGNVFVAGTYNGAGFSIGSTNFNASSSEDLMLVKYDSTGNILWARSAGSSGIDYSKDICTDNSGNLYWTGYFSGASIAFGSQSLSNASPGSTVVFIVKYDPAGNVVWAYSYSASNYAEAYSIAADNANNVYVTGLYTGGSFTLGSTTLINNSGVNMFLVKIDSNGTVIWAKGGDPNGACIGRSVAVNINTEIFVTGEFFATSTVFGATTLSNAGSSNLFLCKFDANGNVNWAKTVNTNSSSAGQAVTTDKLGNVYFAGLFNGPSINFGLGPYPTHGNSDSFLAGYSSSGNLLWADVVGGTGPDKGIGVACDTSNNVYFTLESNGFYYPGGPYGSGNSFDFFAFKFFPDGLWASLTWSSQSTEESANDCVGDDFGNVYFTGYFEGEHFGMNDFLDNPYFPTSDMFVSKHHAPDNNGVGISEPILQKKSCFFPNPSIGVLHFHNPDNRIWNISIFDATGKTVYTSLPGQQIETIDISNQSPGIYFYRLTNEKGAVRTGKLIVE